MSRRPIVFDLDGTLVDSRRDIAVAANYVRERAGLGLLPEETVAGFVGDGACYLIARTLELEESDPRVEAHLGVFLEYYEAHAVDYTTLMPGALEVIEALAPQHAIALCTNKSRRTTLAVLSGLGITERFHAVVAGGDTPRNKPSGDPLLRVAELLNVEPAALVMVGDGPQDILSARAVGAVGVGVRGGILPIERLEAASPDVILDDLFALPAFLASLP